MYLPDLSVYPNALDSANLRAVGWLDSEHEFTRGIAPTRVIDALREILLSNRDVNKMRGTHCCEFCADTIFGKKYVPQSREAFRDYLDKTTIYLEHEGKRKLLGMSEIWIPSPSGIIWAAPSLIYHYSVAHRYLPPQEFQDAVESFDLSPTWDGEAEVEKWLTRQ